jgi:hypothetical protein
VVEAKYAGSEQYVAAQLGLCHTSAAATVGHHAPWTKNQPLSRPPHLYPEQQLSPSAHIFPVFP